MLAPSVLLTLVPSAAIASSQLSQPHAIPTVPTGMSNDSCRSSSEPAPPEFAGQSASPRESSSSLCESGCSKGNSPDCDEACADLLPEAKAGRLYQAPRFPIPRATAARAL